jgi:hypothetical protein
MAAYAATVVSPLRKPLKLFAKDPGVEIYYGTVDITNYNTTSAEITAITGKFRSAPVVIVSGVSDNGYGCRWDATDKSIHAYTYDYDAGADGAAIEASNDTDIGVVHFIAVGLG